MGVLSYFVTRITAGFEATTGYFPAGKTTVTGNPLRESLLVNKSAGAEKVQLKGRKENSPYNAGFQGGQKHKQGIYSGSAEAAKELKGTQFIWMTGSDDYEAAVKTAAANKNVKCCVLRFIDDAGLAYSAADAGVLRAGAGTLTELEAVGLPSLIVPYPFATGNHQEKNAAALMEKSGYRGKGQ